MVQGQSIAPNSDKTMRVPGAVGEFGEDATKSINPTEYMGMSFSYQKWLDEKQKEYNTKQQNKIDVVKDMFANDTQAIKRAERDIEAFKAAPEYNKEAYDKLVAESNKKQEEWKASHGPVMGGSFQYLETALDKYNKDYSDAQNDMKLHYTEMSKALTKDDYNKARAAYNEAASKFEEIAKINPGSEEGKKKYKDEIKTGYNKGITYAAGWGQGGYFGPVGTEKEREAAIARRDQLAANITGGVVGGATATKALTASETMKEAGYFLKTDPDTGELAYFRMVQVKNPAGEMVKVPEKFVGDIPGYGPNKNVGSGPQLKFVDTASATTAQALSGMLEKFNKTGQRATQEQIAEATDAIIRSDVVNQKNILSGLATKYNINPTPENASAYSNYANQAQAMLTQKYVDTVAKFKDLAGPKEKDITSLFGGKSVGSVLGRDIYSTKEGKEYVISGGQRIPLSDVTLQREKAGMRGDYNPFNFPGYGGDTQLRTLSGEAKQWLSTHFGDAGTIVEPKLEKVGDIKVEGVTLDIVQSGGREYVKPETGSLIPLSHITELKNLSTKSGEFAYNTDLYNQEMDLIRTYKNWFVDKSPESQLAAQVASQNAIANPLFTKERFAAISNIVSIGSPLAGMKYENDKITTEPNIAKGILAFTTRTPLDNAVQSKFLSNENANKPVVRDVIQKMSKYGDPMFGIIKLSNTINRSAISPDSLDVVDRESKGYDKLVDKLAISSVSPYSNQVFGIPDSTKTKENQQLVPKNDTNVNYVGVDIPTAKYYDAGDVVGGMSLKKPFVSASTFTSKTPARSGLDSALVFKKRGASGIGFGVNTTGLNVESLYRKSKKSKPKADIKLKKKSGEKSKKSDEFSKLTKSISKFTISIPSMKKKSKKK